MLDPGWVACGLVVVGNIVGWIINRTHSSKDEARWEGKVTEGLKNLTLRVDGLEQRCNDYFSKH